MTRRPITVRNVGEFVELGTRQPLSSTEDPVVRLADASARELGTALDQIFNQLGIH
jgi:hypothetical protein